MDKPNKIITKSTRIFIIVGIFLPAGGAIVILSLQTLISFIGVECSKAFLIIKYFSLAGGIIMPIIFFNYFTTARIRYLALTITFFNVLQYIFIQAFFGLIWENPRALCYGSDGQLGMFFVPAAWAALPVLYVCGLIFEKQYNKRSI
jgi:hypothetical protein